MDKTLKIAAAILAVLVLAGVAVLVFGTAATTQTPVDTQSVTITGVYFFYGEECPHCHEVMPFIINMTKKYPEADIQLLEVWHNQTNQQLFQQMNTDAGITQYGVPEVIVGKTVLIGGYNIPAYMETAIQEYLKKKVNSLSQPNPSPSVTPPASLNTTITTIYFYGDGCEHCEKVRPIISSLQEKYPEMRLEMLEVYSDAVGQQRFVEMNRQYNISNSGIPEIFIGDRALVGETPIREQFEEAILAEKERIASCKTSVPAPATTNCTTPVPELTPQMVIVPALVDSLNPCALSVLIFLLISIAAAADRRRILFIGGSYIAAVFVFHLFVGIGIFSVVTLSGFSKFFSLLGGAIAVLFGIITLSDLIRNRETFFLSVPKSGKGLFSHYSRIASIPAAFILGILAGLLGFTCTGGIYISILALMSGSLTIAAGMPYLILYNIIFILPLVLVTLLVAYGISPEKADTWRTENKRALRLVIGIVMIALGFVIFLGWFG